MEANSVSLLYDAFEPVTMLEKTRVPDGEGGFVTNWTEGVQFDAAITFDSSLQAATAEKAGVSSLYTVTTEKSVILEYHDVFRRNRDGKVFRVTSDGDDKYTPPAATFQVRQVRAEEWVIA